MLPQEAQSRQDREERLIDQAQANKELIRNLAHEIKNPLGGIRGAAQLLEGELDRPNLHEYTQVIMKEADRLQSLMDRLLTPHRIPQPAPLNILEALEREDHAALPPRIYCGGDQVRYRSPRCSYIPE